MKWSRALRAITVVALVGAPLSMASSPASAAIIPTTDVAVGYDHACAVATNGDAYCWGGNTYGQLGDGTNTQSLTPVLVSGGLTWASLDGGNGQTCGITTSGAGYCWGQNNSGQLGDNTTTNRNTPTAINGGGTWTSLTTGRYFTCGVKTGGNGYCWGGNGSGQLGGAAGTQHVPSAISGGHTFVQVSAGNGAQHACGLVANGDAYCWGENGNGQLGIGGTASTGTPTLVAGSHNWSRISASSDNSCGVTTTGVGYCWGNDSGGQLGTGGLGTAVTPTVIAGSHTWSSIVTGEGVNCGFTTTHVGYCWGYGTLGSLGNGANSNSNIPVAISGSYNISVIDTGGGGGCATTNVGVTYCWGWNQYGTLGDGTTTNRNVPTAVMTLSSNSENTTVAVVVDPALSFTVAGYNSGSCNGATISAAGSTSNEIALHPTTSVNSIGGQTLTVSTNASGGFTIYARSSGALNDGNGHTIADWTGTNAAPTSFPSAGTAAFGYTTDDSLSGTATRFQSDKWAGFTGTNAEVGYESAGPVSSSTSHLCTQAGIGASTVAGNYTTTLTYTAIPTF